MQHDRVSEMPPCEPVKRGAAGPSEAAAGRPIAPIEVVTIPPFDSKFVTVSPLRFRRRLSGSVGDRKLPFFAHAAIPKAHGMNQCGQNAVTGLKQ